MNPQSTTTLQHLVFGTGPLGRATMEALRAEGHAVKMFNTSGKRGDLPADVSVEAINLNDPSSVRKAVQGASIVYMCAQPDYTEWVEKFPPLIQSVIEGLSGSAVKLVMGDNQYMYGAFSGTLTEKSAQMPHTKKGKVRLQIANTLMSAHDSGKLRVTFARAADFFGPYAAGSVIGESFFEPLLKGKTASIYGNVDAPRHFTYIKDFGRALATLGTHDNAFGRAWLVPNTDLTTFRKFAEMAYEVAGLPNKARPMGGMMIRIGGLFVPEAREMIEMMYEFQNPYVVDSSDFTRTFGWSGTPLRPALEATIAWFRAHMAASAAGIAK